MKYIAFLLFILLSCKKEHDEPPAVCKTCYSDIEVSQSPYIWVPVYSKDTFESCKADTVKEIDIIYYVLNGHTYRKVTSTECR